MSDKPYVRFDLDDAGSGTRRHVIVSATRDGCQVGINDIVNDVDDCGGHAQCWGPSVGAAGIWWAQAYSSVTIVTPGAAIAELRRA